MAGSYLSGNKTGMRPYSLSIKTYVRTLPLLIAISMCQYGHAEKAKLEKARTALEILQKTAQAYRKCQTYSDTGKILYTIAGPEKIVTSVSIDYTLYFSREGKLRYEFHNEDWSCLIFANGKNAKSLWLEGPESGSMRSTFEACMRGLLVKTYLTASYIPYLLDSDLFKANSSLPRLSPVNSKNKFHKMERLKDLSIKNNDYYLLSVKPDDNKEKLPYIVSIHRRTFLISQIDYIMPLKYEGYTMFLSFRCQPRVNSSIDSKSSLSPVKHYLDQLKIKIKAFSSLLPQ